MATLQILVVVPYFSRPSVVIVILIQKVSCEPLSFPSNNGTMVSFSSEYQWNIPNLTIFTADSDHGKYKYSGKKVRLLPTVEFQWVVCETIVCYTAYMRTIEPALDEHIFDVKDA